MVEFTYNNSFQASIGIVFFKALYGWRKALLLGPEMLQQVTEQVKLIREKIKASQDRQKSYYDKRKKPLDF